MCVCNDMLTIFPKLKLLNSAIGGMDLYYNPDTKTGFLFNKFKNRARQFNDSLQEEPIVDVLSDEQKAEYGSFFKTCVAAKQTHTIKNKLRETAPHREALMKYFESDFKNIWKFYFAMPELIVFDFGVLYESVDQTALERHWDGMMMKMHILFRTEIPNNIVPVSDVNILNFVGLLKCFSAIRANIKTSVGSMFTFSKSPTDDPIKLMSKKNSDPNIIIIWSQSNENDEYVFKYYIDVKKKLLSVPEDYSFVQMIGLFFKASKVFHVGLNKYVTPLFRVFEKYVYAMNGDQRDLTPKHLEDAELMFKED